MTDFVKISSIKVNPANPRIIRDERYRKLVQSVAQFPKMLDVRGIVVDGKKMIMGGNQRFRAVCDVLNMPDGELAAVLREHPESLARWERIRDKKGHIPANWILHAGNFTPDELRRFIIADNVEFGEHDWDALANGWDTEDLAEWGVDVPGFDGDGILDENELIGSLDEKPFQIQITFENVETLNEIEKEIKVLIEGKKGIFYSVSGKLNEN